MSVDAIYDNFTSPAESIKLWRRDWENFPDDGRAMVRVKSDDGVCNLSMGWRNEQRAIVGNFPNGWELLGWYPAPNPDSDAAYGDPGEEIGG